MGKIRVLDDHIANQIAAGEVVERPSSVVKELVENAVDAGSTAIDVTIEEGGLQVIKVSDNGSGIDPDDVEAAFLRHATSKIASGKDLFRIVTLGFRGEALPSIAAVAKVECLTASAGSGLGRRLLIEGGAIQSAADAAAPKGTSIAVRELFFNTPARLKYMKTVQTELSHISDYMYRLAMAHPGIAFSLKHNGSMLLQTEGGGDLLQVIAAVYGTATAKQMVAVKGENPDYALAGYVSRPELNRSSRNAVSAFINGRYIRNFTLAQAVLQAYHTLLPVHRYPVSALHIQMDPILLDVNVHPAKLEVRFSKEAELIQFVTSVIEAALRGQVLIPSGAKPQAVKSPYIQEKMELYRPGTAPVRSDTRSFPVDAGSFTRASETSDRTETGGTYRPPERNPFADISRIRSGSAPAEPAKQRPSSAGSGVPASQQPAHDAETVRRWSQALTPTVTGEPPAAPAFPRLHPIGQLHGTYIVAQNEDGLFLIDQHAAHERINYEHYFELFGRPPEASQQLLVPITLDYTPSDAELLRSRLPLIGQVGVELESFGGNSFIVRSYPHWFPVGEERRIIDEMTEWVISEKKAVDIGKLREKSAILCSCKASIKANQSLQTVEMEALLDRLAACRNPYTCPHGRPIVVSFSSYDLEKMFKRVM